MVHRRLTIFMVLFFGIALSAARAVESKNAGHNQAQTDWDFNTQVIEQFNRPWAFTFLPNQFILVTEKPGAMYLLNEHYQKQPVHGVPAVYNEGQNGLLSVLPAPDFKQSQRVYFTLVQPKEGAGVLTLMRAQLLHEENQWHLEHLETLWQQEHPSQGGHPGGIIAFSPEEDTLFLTVGERMQGQYAQDLNDSRGKILRMTLDGQVPENNPMAEAGGVQAYIWSYGHRNPYGLAFDKNKRLWSHEMGPKGGDELNLIQPKGNYGWPIVSNGDHYDGRPIASHDTRPDFIAPLLYWTPVISPSGLVFYEHDLFPSWQGNAFIGGLSSQALIRVAFDEQGVPNEVQRFAMGHRIRDVQVDSHGYLWLLEDGPKGRLLKLKPKDTK